MLAGKKMPIWRYDKTQFAICNLQFTLFAEVGEKRVSPKIKQMNTQIKICGITNLDNAQAAVEAGADALGFVFYNKSPRNMTIPAVARIFKKTRLRILRVGVFVNAPKDFVLRAVAECGLSLLQFHGDETPEFPRNLMS